MGTDTDRDGVIDAVEDRQWVLPTLKEDGSLTSEFELDSSRADTDGDGLIDGREVTFYRVDGQWAVYGPQSFSNPSLTDSDKDGLGDAEEVGPLCPSAVVVDSDSDGLTDKRDPNPCDSENIGAALNENGRAMIEGAALGETGMPDGVVTSGYNDNPGYLIGWIGLSVVPVIDIPADLRDAAQNTGQGDYGDAALDAVSLAPFLASDAPKAIKISSKWAKVNPGKSDEAYAALRKSGLTKNLKLDDRVKIASAFKQYDAAIIRIGEESDKVSLNTAKALASNLGKKNAKYLVTYDGPYALSIKRSVVGFYGEGRTINGKFIPYMNRGQIDRFADELRYLQRSDIEYRESIADIASQDGFKKGIGIL
ncbi:hypothetical protein [Halomicrobium mukohataei]|uniref:Calcium-binding protein n=2 Tax=Halomicrobium mukohataei TaxID=57705 RepID=C7P553_HALMD|nr:hypothetical protein [Halomicrobium mukohataei]ACV49448.1 hypothetical protein Hmuk_3362 [Halomicrobium mukohataei DSM 12286]QCD67271.1 hypothetical protein E5139_16670 [Halomicrobium mukohataei]